MRNRKCIDITGQQFGKLTAISFVKKDTKLKAIWLFKCECGNYIEKAARHVKNIKGCKSCGCLQPWTDQKPYYKDLTGNIFGKLIVTNYVGKNDKGQSLWETVCSCNNQTRQIKIGTELSCGKIKSCGCSQYSPRLLKDLTGQKFDKLTVINFSHKDKSGRAYWLCQCSCDDDNTVTVQGYSLINGATTSCGCKLHRKGIYSPKWNHKLTNEERGKYFRQNDQQYKEWANKVKKKDNFTCQKCKKKGGALRSHHIASYSRVPQCKYLVDNGICLCKKCHEEFHKKYGKHKFQPLDTIEFLLG